MSTLRQLIGRFRLQLRAKNHIVVWNMTAEEVIAFFLRQRKTVLTFYGYSRMGYEDEKAMLEIARKVLSRYSPESTLVNIVVTSVCISTVYSLVKSMGFT